MFERAGVPKHLRPLVGGKVNVDLIDRNWADILRVAATMAAGTMRPSQLLRKLAAYPRQNELAAALREVGRIERSLFMIAGLNLLAAIIIYWNTLKLGEAVFAKREAGLEVPAEFLTHVSPLGWEHINLTGEYRWPGAGARST